MGRWTVPLDFLDVYECNGLTVIDLPFVCKLDNHCDCIKITRIESCGCKEVKKSHMIHDHIHNSEIQAKRCLVHRSRRRANGRP